MKLSTTLLSVLFLTVLVISGIAGWFYWFQWRPAEIRKECAEVKEKYTEEIKGRGYSITKSVPAIELKYETCLNEKGLK